MTSVTKNKKYYTLLEHFTLLKQQRYFRKTIAVKEMVTRKKNGKLVTEEETVYKLIRIPTVVDIIIGDNEKTSFKGSINVSELVGTPMEFWLNLPVLDIQVKYNNIRAYRERVNSSMIMISPNKETLVLDSDKLKYSITSERVAYYNGSITIHLQDLPEIFIKSPLYTEDLFSKDVFNSLLVNGNTIYSRLYFKKALEYYNNDQKELEKELSRVCDFDVRIRAARSDLKEDVKYLNPEYYIVESLELVHSKSVSNPK